MKVCVEILCLDRLQPKLIAISAFMSTMTRAVFAFISQSISQIGFVAKLFGVFLSFCFRGDNVGVWKTLFLQTPKVLKRGRFSYDTSQCVFVALASHSAVGVDNFKTQTFCHWNFSANQNLKLDFIHFILCSPLLIMRRASKHQLFMSVENFEHVGEMFDELKLE